MTQLELRCKIINDFFINLKDSNSRLIKEAKVTKFKAKYPNLNKDLDFCFEVLAGKHKLGYTYCFYGDNYVALEECANYTIKKFINKVLKTTGATQNGIEAAWLMTPPSCRSFIRQLVNREFKLGYSNKQNMITNLSPMLAKKYPEMFTPYVKYYIQEKLDGNRCIAYYDFDEQCWKFQSRSGKPLNLNFDMSWANEELIFDGEVMTLTHAGSRDFNKTSGAINSKYGDKSGLHYFIYDLVDETLIYEDRLCILKGFKVNTLSSDCTILDTLGDIELYPNPNYNCQLDTLLDNITSKGGEGLILRLANGLYEHKRSNNLLKYKKTQTMDLRIIGWNEGKGKYQGCIGSFICETDDHSIVVNVAGMSDDIRTSNPELWIGKIIEVAYFLKSRAKDSTTYSLRFPRMKRSRPDKNDTSIY